MQAFTYFVIINKLSTLGPKAINVSNLKYFS